MRSQIAVLVAGILLANGLQVASPEGTENASKKTPENGGQSIAQKQMGLLLGSPDFMPTPERPIGWRGDGTGIYPGATPPVEWGRWPEATAGLRYQVEKPKSDAPGGEPLLRGNIMKWLMLGPYPADEPEKAFIDEANAQPDVGESVGECKWIAAKGRFFPEDFSRPDVISLNAVYGYGKVDKNRLTIGAGRMAYAHAYVYSPDSIKVGLNVFKHGWLKYFKIWVNGKPPEKETEVTLNKGWNRIMLKGKERMGLHIRPATPCPYVTKNIQWMTPMPSGSASMPVIVGNKLITTADSMDLICMDKTTGKILWIRSHSFYDIVGEDEKKANSAFKEKVEPLVSQVKDLNQKILETINGAVTQNGPDYGASDPLGGLAFSKQKLEGQIANEMRAIDPKKYLITGNDDAGYWSPTPVSDGSRIYMWFGAGVAVCYDLDGNRQWIRREGMGGGDHGTHISPALCDGKVIVGSRVIGERNAIQLAGFDVKTGAEVWRRADIPLSRWASPVCAKVGGENVVINRGGKQAYRVSNGETAWDGGEPILAGGECSPVVVDGIFYNVIKGKILGLKLPEKTGTVPATAFSVDLGGEEAQKQGFLACITGSMLSYDGMAYVVSCVGGITAADMKAGQVSAQVYPPYCAVVKLGQAASIAAAGNRIYIMDNYLSTAVLAAGREAKILAVNHLMNYKGNYPPSVQGSLSTPVFDGDKIYIRSQNLYCIGQNKGL